MSTGCDDGGMQFWQTVAMQEMLYHPDSPVTKGSTMEAPTPVAATPRVYAAINEVTAELARVGISKGRKNQQQGYAFRGIDDVYAALSSLLAQHHLCILPRVVSHHVEERPTAKGGMLFNTTVKMEFDIVCAVDGSKHTVAMIGEAMDSADKSSNKAQSAAYKYMAFQTFCIPTEGDNDADATTHDVSHAAPGMPPAQLQTWLAAIAVATTAETLKSLWLQATDAANAAFDRAAYDQIKAAVFNRQEQLGIAPPEGRNASMRHAPDMDDDMPAGDAQEEPAAPPPTTRKGAARTTGRAAR